MSIVVTGAQGFIGRNLMVRLQESGLEAVPIGSDADEAAWRDNLSRADLVVHLAGVNRPVDEADFVAG